MTKSAKSSKTYAWRSSSDGGKSDLEKLVKEVIALFSRCLKKKPTITKKHVNVS